MAASKVSFNKGDYCRISYDEQLYECQVLEIAELKTKVQLIGHDVNLEVDKKSILPSLGKSTRVKQDEDAKICKALKAGDLCRAIRDGKFAEAKIWQLAEDDQKKRYAVVAFVDFPEAEITVWIESLKPAWKVDDYCRVQWSEDQVIYESQIKSIDSTDGQRFAIVEFLGYGNQDSAWINDIMETMGDKPRQLQIAQGQGTLPQVEPEETAVWKDRDACRVVIGNDNAEYEGTIKALNEDGSAVVHLIGMGKDVKQMMSELKPSAGKDARAKQRVKATSEEEETAKGIDNDAKEPIIKVPSWEVGAFCRGVFKEDGLEYEGVIKSIETSGDGQYTIVQFIGYGNEESIWVQDLLESGGEGARQKQTKEALGEEVVVNGHNDTTAPTDETDSGPIKTNIDKAWQPGMFCRGVYKEDGLEYEGLIKSVESTDDGQYAVVEFVGYGNQETLWFQELLKSAGDMARQKQTKEALGEVVDANESEAVVDEVKAAPAEIKTLDESLASSGSSSTVTVIAKEPWQAGMFCLSIYKEDGEAYEGLVKSIESSEADGGQYAVVQFIGYGNEDTVWLQDLRQSKGEAARQQQVELLEAVDVVDGQASSLVATEPIDQNGNIAKESSTETDKKVDANKDNPKSFAKEWHIGDFSRVLCEFDGQEHEVEILKQHPSNPEVYRVQVLGYGHKEVKNCTLLKESLGETARKAQIEEVAAKSAPTPTEIKNTTITPPTRNESVVSVIKKLQDTNNNNQPKAVNGEAKDREYSPLKEAPKAPKLSVAIEDMNNNYQAVNKVVDLPNASGDTMDWKKKFEMKSAQFDEVSKVNGYLMTTLNKMEMEMQGHVGVIQELKSSIKACLSNCPSAQPGKGLVNGY